MISDVSPCDWTSQAEFGVSHETLALLLVAGLLAMWAGQAVSPAQETLGKIVRNGSRVR